MRPAARNEGIGDGEVLDEGHELSIGVEFTFHAAGRPGRLETVQFLLAVMREGKLLRQSGPGPAALSGSEVHLWKISLDQAPKLSLTLREVLSPDEKRGIEGFHFERDKASFCMCRGFLRTLLGRYIDTAPDEIRFQTGKYGKLSLDPFYHKEEIEFNVSHSGKMALLALAKNRRLGVDVEKVRSAARIDDISRAFFSPQEDESIRALPDLMRVAAFYACWTRKEAAVKALGASLMELSGEVIVSTPPGEPARLLRLPREHGEPGAWHLHDLPVGQGYAAALCYEGSSAATFLWEPPGESISTAPEGAPAMMPPAGMKY